MTPVPLYPPPPPHPPRPSTAASSFLSSSPSNEADDEQSSVSHQMGPTRERYAGEDARLTSDKELSGFYMYGWAAEVFVVCGIGSFIPMTLEELARQRGVLLSDRTTPCRAKNHFPDLSLLGSNRESGQCVVYILGAEINTASFAMYTFSISVLVQALLIISMSGAADHGRFRKMFLLACAFTGSIATMLFLPVVPKVYLIGALLAIIANTCFGASFVLLNSFLPLLVRHHPTVQREDPESSSDDLSQGERSQSHASSRNDHGVIPEASENTALLGPHSEAQTSTPYAIPAIATMDELALSTKISSYGIGIGYIAAVIVQCFSIVILILRHNSSDALRIVLFVIGAWWFIFTIPTAFWLRPRPGPPLHMTAESRSQAFVAYLSYSWRSLGKTIARARNLKDVLLFLGAWFLLSDGIATVGGTAVLFAKTSLQMDTSAVALISVIVTLSGVVGAFAWSRLAGLMGLRPTQTIMTCLCLFELIPLYGLLGYIPAIQRLGVIGLQQPWEMYPLGAIYGFALGGLSSYCRSLFGELIPPGYETAFFALYAITDKGSSVFGPAIVGAITDATGEIRPAFFFLAALVGCTFPLMALVDVERGRRDGLAMAMDLKLATENLSQLSSTVDGSTGSDEEEDPQRLLRRRESDDSLREGR